jgi:ABC-type lipoprotein export system ATPase subunit
MVTHDRSALSHATRTITLVDGRVAGLESPASA